MTRTTDVSDSGGQALRPLGFAGAVTRQFALLWVSRRPPLLALGMFAIVMLIEVWPSPLARLVKAWPFWLVLVGPVWALAVWHKEEPSSRRYMWSQPVDRAVHSLARVAAGLGWLWIACVALVGLGYLVALFDGNAGQLGHLGVASWVSLFTAPVIGYLAVSCLTVASDYPMRWLMGILLGPPLVLGVLDAWLGFADRMLAAVRPVAAWGITSVLVGPWTTDANRILVALEAADSAKIRFAFVESTWWMATILWAVGFGMVLFVLASRHPDGFHRRRRKVNQPDLMVIAGPTRAGRPGTPTFP